MSTGPKCHSGSARGMVSFSESWLQTLTNSNFYARVEDDKLIICALSVTSFVVAISALRFRALCVGLVNGEGAEMKVKPKGGIGWNQSKAPRLNSLVHRPTAVSSCQLWQDLMARSSPTYVYHDVRLKLNFAWVVWHYSLWDSAVATLCLITKSKLCYMSNLRTHSCRFISMCIFDTRIISYNA